MSRIEIKNPTSNSAVQHVDQSLSRYDFLLALISLPITTGVAATALGHLPTFSGLGIGSFLSALVVRYGLLFAKPSV